MTDVMPEPVVDLDALVAEPAAREAVEADVLDAVDEQLLDRLVGRAREGGLRLTGAGGLLAQLTKRLVESALDRAQRPERQPVLAGVELRRPGSALAVTAVTTSPAVAASAALWAPIRPSRSSRR